MTQIRAHIRVTARFLFPALLALTSGAGMPLRDAKAVESVTLRLPPPASKPADPAPLSTDPTGESRTGRTLPEDRIQTLPPRDARSGATPTRPAVVRPPLLAPPPEADLPGPQEVSPPAGMAPPAASPATPARAGGSPAAIPSMSGSMSENGLVSGMITRAAEAEMLALTNRAGRDDKGLWLLVGDGKRARPRGSWRYAGYHPDGDFYIIQRASPLQDPTGRDSRPTPMNMILFRQTAKDQTLEGSLYFSPDGQVMISDRPDYVKGGRALLSWTRQGNSYRPGDRFFVRASLAKQPFGEVEWNGSRSAGLGTAKDGSAVICLTGGPSSPRLKACR